MPDTNQAENSEVLFKVGFYTVRLDWLLKHLVSCIYFYKKNV